MRKQADNPMEVVFALLDARRRRDLDAVSDLLDPAVIHEGFIPDLRCDGRDQVLHNIERSFVEANARLNWIELTRAGEHVVVGLSGPRFRDAPWAGRSGRLFIVHSVRDGRVVAMRDFLDREEALRAAGVESA